MLIWFFAVRVLYMGPVPLVMEMNQVATMSIIRQSVCVKPRQNTRNLCTVLILNSDLHMLRHDNECAESINLFTFVWETTPSDRVCLFTMTNKAFYVTSL